MKREVELAREKYTSMSCQYDELKKLYDALLQKSTTHTSSVPDQNKVNVLEIEQRIKTLDQENIDLKNKIQESTTEHQKDIASRIELEQTLKIDIESKKVEILNL